ncbi:uncharacterized protein LOC116849316 [Odontomachus brunneus]|uniref:uncharacterized protein LOC116849316 n=1 Tax=Odontomachus brunneus TaxID=486640 RepID=UPI0013F22FF3|nr:uncharacterized protein LOC116849316 [Odontomachus brunneus]XP_032682240.1 uncharacterized protein LOC116849316 [Odontomachus brunneus]XP_032682241.1 uncharacterized protein LOC116849316 [Odontomachus brunneus]XP_032682242.1 uncharacterized protein LOC116849316 [Odontomachus brunneus]
MLRQLYFKTTNKESKNILLMQCLPSLLPPSRQVQLGTKKFKPTIKESRDAFIANVKIPGQVQNFIAERREKICNQFGRSASVQPYILYVAKQLDVIDEIFVVIDDFYYKLGTFQQALDICFKTFFVLDMVFTAQCDHVWLLIQKTLYGFTTTEDANILKPEAFIVGHSLSSKHSYGSVLMEPTDLYGQFIPMRSVLRAFLELLHVFNKILSYMNKLGRSDGSIIENLIQAKLWKEKIKPRFPGKLLLPIGCYYYDEFEPGDTCSPHNGVNKIGVLYYFLPCLSPEDRSALENMFSAQIVYAQDKYFGNGELFRRTLHELQYLETEGITIVVNGTETQDHFALAVFVGDTEGVRNVLGFINSFNANYCCRRCKVHKSISYTQTKVNTSLLRNR